MTIGKMLQWKVTMTEQPDQLIVQLSKTQQDVLTILAMISRVAINHEESAEMMKVMLLKVFSNQASSEYAH